MYPSKGIALILAFFSLSGLFGLDKFYTGNYILGSIQSLLTLGFITIPFSIILNLVTIVALLILIFTNFNLLIYVDWGNETTQFDYMVAIAICIYFFFKYKKISDDLLVSPFKVYTILNSEKKNI